MLSRKGAEKFLILDIASSGANGLFLRVTADREIIFEKFEKDIDLGRFLESPVRRAMQASWEGEYVFDGRRRILAVADSSLATTIPMPVSFRRETERRHLPITLEELDDRIAQMMPRLTSQCRAEAARRFGDDAVEVVLVGAVVRRMSVDGKPTVHPLGFLGVEVNFTIEFTFTRRTVFEQLRSLFNSPEPFFFGESAQVRLDVVSSVRPLPLSLMAARDGGNDAALFVLQTADDGAAVLYRERFSWSFEPAVARIEEMFSVSRAAAYDIYRAYVGGGMSEDAKRTMRGVFDESAERFEDALRKTKIRGFAYLDASFPPPFPLPHRAGKTTVEAVPLAEICAKFGVTLRRSDLSGVVLWRHLAPFFRMYFDHDQAAVNALLRKRVHWLAN